jgi:hypothetical protein
LGNQEFLLASLALLVITSIGCLALVGKSRWQKSKIEDLSRQLQAAQRPPTPIAEVPMKVAR